MYLLTFQQWVLQFSFQSTSNSTWQYENGMHHRVAPNTAAKMASIVLIPKKKYVKKVVQNQNIKIVEGVGGCRRV